MRLNRNEFLNAVSFLKHAISNHSVDSETGFLKIKFDEGKAVMMSNNGYVAKRVTLVEAVLPDTIDGQKKTTKKAGNPEKPFLIDKATLESFETLCSKHKSALAEKAKKDPELGVIEIDKGALVSHNRILTYQQPIGLKGVSIDFDDLKRMAKSEAVLDLFINPGNLADALNGFDKSDSIGIIFNGYDSPAYFSQYDQTYEAFCSVIKPRESDE